VDQCSVQDALKCLVAIASGSPEGRQIILESSGLPAVCWALRLGSTTQQMAATLLVCLLNAPERERILQGDHPYSGAPAEWVVVWLRGSNIEFKKIVMWPKN
jgi:hypothetical protein